MFLLS